MPSLGLGLYLGAANLTQGGGYLPEAAALFARMTTQPSPARKSLINTTIVGLKDAGVWSKLDALYVPAAHDAQAARRNWLADEYNLTAVSAPTFTVDRGYAGDGTSSYLDTGMNPSTAVGLLQGQDDLSIMLWSLTGGQSNNGDIGNSNAFISPRTTTNILNLRVNSPSSVTTPNTDATGMFVATRTSSSQVQAYRNGSTFGAILASTSAAPESAAYRVCGRSGAFVSSSIRQSAAASFGPRLSVQETSDFYTILLAYMQAVGAA